MQIRLRKDERNTNKNAGSKLVKENVNNDCNIKLTRYPSLANLVKQILCIPATSAPVKRVSSRGSIVVRPHRSSLAPQRLHKISFFKCNEHAFDASELL